MQQIRVSGRADVATLLRSLADGVDSGRIELGDRILGCTPGLDAVVDGPAGGDAVSVLTVVLRSGEPGRRRPGLGVEQELTHPGG